MRVMLDNHGALWIRLHTLLQRRSLALYLAGRAAHVKTGRRAHTYRWTPDEFANDAVRTLGYGGSEEIAATIRAYELRGF